MAELGWAETKQQQNIVVESGQVMLYSDKLHAKKVPLKLESDGSKCPPWAVTRRRLAGSAPAAPKENIDFMKCTDKDTACGSKEDWVCWNFCTNNYKRCGKNTTEGQDNAKRTCKWYLKMEWNDLRLARVRNALTCAVVACRLA